MIDLHCHVLPGVDDGPEDLEAALAMMRAYDADGVETVVATPHLRADFPDVVPAAISSDALELDRAAHAEGARAQIIAGAELDLTWALQASDAQLRAASLEGLGSDLLVETPPEPLAPGVEDALFALVLRGYRVTLAHPELSAAYQREPSRLAELVSRGVLLQVTANAMLRSPRQSASAALGQALVRDGLCAALASDAHSAGPWRPPELARSVVAAARITSPARAAWLVLDGPDAILAGERLPALPRIPASPRGRAWLRQRAGA